MIRVLHVISSLDGGGVESMLFNYYSNLDRKKIQFDFVVHGDDVGMLEERLHIYNTNIFHVTPKKVSVLKNMIEINRVIKKNNYDVVHCHQNFSNAPTLLIAKLNSVKVRISHAHGSKEEYELKVIMKNKIARLINNYFANYYFSCGIRAGKWLHGEKWLQNEENILMNNAIDVNKFRYNKEIRSQNREKYKLGKKIVLLHVGRFSKEKNHLFLINIMELLVKKSDRYVLLFVGNGILEDTLKKCVQDKGLVDNIIFLGVRKDIAELMNIADIFLLPSMHEGFPVTLIEAQSTGINILASSEITKETAITDLIEYISIEKEELWVEKIINTKIENRNSRSEDIKREGYSIKEQAIKYENWLGNVLNHKL
ncbi:glycosyltransferase [Sporosarcina sp. P29]|uniref:glycosyltransferase n=1 Tax=Sporosarcina sp. P29 TaxID=2048252 RepID=UPI000C1731B2|nr:glycosyltransferase [Sporosarcina sp. P29]PIC99892.1 hypothetical protein CSV68_05385 [Sporosarcina sp. P29]